MVRKRAIRRCRAYILEHNLATEEELDKIEKKVIDDIEAAIEFAKASPDPKPEDALTDVFYEGGNN